MFKEPENEIALAGIGMIGAVLLGHKRQDKGFRPAGSLCNSRGAKPTVTARTRPNPDKSIAQCQRKGHRFSYPGAYVLLGLGFRWAAFSFLCIGLLAAFFVNRPLEKKKDLKDENSHFENSLGGKRNERCDN